MSATVPPERRPRDRWPLAIAIAAFLLRLGWAGTAGVFWITAEQLGGGDERSYVELAQAMAQDPAQFVLGDERCLTRAPGQVAYLAVFSGFLAGARLLNILFSTATVVLVMALAGQAGGTVAARAAGIAVAVCPPLISGASSLLTETPFTLLVLAGLAALARALSAPRHAAFLAALGGACFGVASLFRPVAQGLAPALALAATAAALLGVPAARSLRRPTWIAFAAALAVLTPVVVKNGVRFGRFAIANGLGAVAYLGANPATAGDDPAVRGIPLAMPECSGDPHSTPCDRIFLRQAVQWVRADPAEFLRRIPVKVHRTWVGNQREVFFPARGWRETAGLNWRGVVWRVASILGSALLAGSFLWAVLRGDWRRDATVLLCATTVGWLTLVTVLTFALPRFGEPLAPCFAVVGGISAARADRFWPGLLLAAGLALCTFLGP